ncbi:uncharacterized protein EI90DRAFT_3157325 [Cantharellus anzutake]|uniref:uncharacterized protein n=1 Tax=Cantharellus anzutake TaxID=1750568 RepID=UPI0019040DA7|nr:uncharacterized protein EI90DRAFT_3157325 [Cantharellus anzutake]KAF8324598.1 hypothetical protein EI90DRAFT_3157325 [Cantharellus anzutake]
MAAITRSNGDPEEVNSPNSAHDALRYGADMNSPQQAVVASIVHRLRNQLPQNSGLSLLDLEVDPAMQQTVEALVQIAQTRLDFVVWSLAELLQKILKPVSPPPREGIPLDVLLSILHVLKVMTTAMTRHWVYHRDETLKRAKNFHDQVKDSWVDPPPFDEPVAEYILIVMIRFLRQQKRFQPKQIRAPGHTRTGSFPDFGAIDMRGAKESFQATYRTLFPLVPAFSVGRHQWGLSVEKGDTYEYPQSAFEMTATSFHLSNSTATIEWLIHLYSCRAIFYLSASNWPVVFAKIHSKLRDIADSVKGEEEDMTEVRLIAVCALDRDRLFSILRELSSLLVSMGPKGKVATTLCLRPAICTWAVCFPTQVREQIVNPARMEGTTERLYDKLFSMMLSMLPQEQPSLWAALASLLITAPDRLRQLTQQAYEPQNTKRQPNFLMMLQKALFGPSLLNSELSMACYVIFCKAHTMMASLPDSSPIRSNAYEFASDLHAAIFRPTQEQGTMAFHERDDVSNRALYTDVLAAIHRYNGSTVKDDLFSKCLVAESDVVKLCAVDAILTLIIEYRRFSPEAIGDLYTLARGLRRLFINIVKQEHRTPNKQFRFTAPSNDPTMSREVHDSWSTDPTLCDRDHLLLGIMSIIRLDPQMLLHESSESEDIEFPEALANIIRPNMHPTVRLSGMKVSATFGEELLRASRSGGLSPQLRQMAAWQVRTARFKMEHLHDEEDFSSHDHIYLQSIHAYIAAKLLLYTNRSQTYSPFRVLEDVVSSEVLAILYLASGRDGSVNLACDLLGVVGRADALGMTSIKMYIPEENARKRADTYFELNETPDQALGRLARQKRIRACIRKLAFTFPFYTVAWMEIYRRWQILLESCARIPSDTQHSLTHPNLSNQFLNQSSTSFTIQDDSKEWANLTLFLASFAGCCTSSDISETNSSSLDDLVAETLPLRLQRLLDSGVADAAKDYLRQMVDFLTVESVQLRELAKEALGNELSPNMFPNVLSFLGMRIEDTFGATLPDWDAPFILFADQAMSVLKSIVDRADAFGSKPILPAETLDLGATLNILVRFVHQASNNDQGWRAKSKLCVLIDAVTSRRDYFPLRKDNNQRNVILDTVSGWSSHSFPDVLVSDASGRLINDLDLACLQCVVSLTNGLRLEAVDGSNALHSIHMESRLFYRYFTFFSTVIDRWMQSSREHDPQYAPESASVSSGHLSKPMSDQDHSRLWEYSVQGINNLLQANMRAGLAHCLRLSYHEDARVRALFLTMFTKALKDGADFDVAIPMTKPVHEKTSKLCELLKSPDLVMASVLLERWPSPDHEGLCELILNVFNTRGTLMYLLKAVIDQEVGLAPEKALFRGNDMRNLLLTAFCRKYGYQYLHRILTPLLEIMLSQADTNSYEVDPNKLRPNEDIETNAENLRIVTQAFLNVVVGSVDIVPPMIRELCEHIARRVEERGERGKEKDAISPAIGAFVFLRFISPAVVSPWLIDMDAPFQNAKIRRGLVFVAKIVQNLANNVRFGREKFMVPFNRFLAQNIEPVTQYVKALLSPTPGTNDLDNQATIGSPYDETDHMLLHKFMQKNADSIGKDLLRSRDSPIHQLGAVTHQQGKMAWDNLCGALVEIGAPPKITPPPDLSSAQHDLYLNFLLRNAVKWTGNVEPLFLDLDETAADETTFLFRLGRINVEKIDVHVLIIHIFRTVTSASAAKFNLLLDCTGFCASSEMPFTWFKEFFEVAPMDLLSRLDEIRIVNPNRFAQRFLRKAHFMLEDVPLKGRAAAYLSTSPEFRLLYPSLKILDEEESESGTDLPVPEPFSSVILLDERRVPTHVTLNFEQTFVRVTTKTSQRLYPGLKSLLTDLIHYTDIDDVFKSPSREKHNEFIVRRGEDYIILDSPACDDIIRAFRIAKGRSRASRTGFTRGVVVEGDISAIFINLGLINVSHSDFTLRCAAFELIYAASARLKYNDGNLLVSRGSFTPSNPTAFATHFSEKLSQFAPGLTLDFMKEFSIGYDESPVVQKQAAVILKKYSMMQIRHPNQELDGGELPPADVQRARMDTERSSRWQKSICLHFLRPWIRNLSRFRDPNDGLFDASEEGVRSMIRMMIDITIRDTELSATIHQCIWTEVAKLDGAVVQNLVLDELVKAAAEAGFGTRACESIADVFSIIGTVNVKAKLLGRVRRTLAKASAFSLDDSPWNELGALTRLCLIAFYNPRTPIQTQLFVPELAHFITLLAAHGPLLMRTSIYGIFVNLIHSLCAARTDDPNALKRLREILTHASNDVTLHSFGLKRVSGRSEELALYPHADGLDVESLESVTGTLVELITIGAPSSGLQNTWRARWMSLATFSAFQLISYTQARAFVVVGILRPITIEDDLLYQILVALKAALNEPELKGKDMTPMVSMIRCIHKLIGGLPLNSRGLPPLIWLAVALLKISFLPLFMESAQLLSHVISTLRRHESYARSDLVSLFESSLCSLESGKIRIERYISIGTDCRFSLSLSAVIIKGLRHPPTSSSAEALLRSLLQFGARFIQPIPQSGRPVHHSVIGFFLALLPTCKSNRQFKELARIAGCDLSPTNGVSGDDFEYEAIRVPFSMLGIANADYALLVTTFIVSMLNSSQSSKETDMLFALLSDASLAFPEVVTLTFESMLDKINEAYVTSNNRRILQSLSTISTQANKLSLTSAASAISLLFDSSAPRYYSRMKLNMESQPHRRVSSEHARALEAADMLDLLDDHQFTSPDHPSCAKEMQRMQNLVSAVLACF